MKETDMLSAVAQETRHDVGSAASAVTVFGARAWEGTKQTLLSLAGHELHRFLRRAKPRTHYRRLAMGRR